MPLPSMSSASYSLLGCAKGDMVDSKQFFFSSTGSPSIPPRTGSWSPATWATGMYDATQAVWRPVERLSIRYGRLESNPSPPSRPSLAARKAHVILGRFSSTFLPGLCETSRDRSHTPRPRKGRRGPSRTHRAWIWIFPHSNGFPSSSEAFPLRYAYALRPNSSSVSTSSSG